jgi:hypothetical protein
MTAHDVADPWRIGFAVLGGNVHGSAPLLSWIRGCATPLAVVRRRLVRKPARGVLTGMTGGLDNPFHRRVLDDQIPHRTDSSLPPDPQGTIDQAAGVTRQFDQQITGSFGRVSATPSWSARPDPRCGYPAYRPGQSGRAGRSTTWLGRWWISPSAWSQTPRRRYAVGRDDGIRHA